MDKYIYLALKKHSTHIYTVISDNVANMIKMGKLTLTKNWHLTCNSHTSDLVANNLISKLLIKRKIKLGIS
jgi:hypothetical protein